MLNILTLGVSSLIGCKSDTGFNQVDLTNTDDTAKKTEPLPHGDFQFSSDSLCDMAGLTIQISNICPTVLRESADIFPPEDLDGNGLADDCEQSLSASQGDLVASIIQQAGIASLADGCPALTYHISPATETHPTPETTTRTAKAWLIFDQAIGEISADEYINCQSTLPQDALCLEIEETLLTSELADNGALKTENARMYHFSMTEVGPEMDSQEIGNDPLLAFSASTPGDGNETENDFATLFVNTLPDYTNDTPYKIDPAILSGANMLQNSLETFAGVCQYDWQTPLTTPCEGNSE
jgi:hypothetical protein